MKTYLNRILSLFVFALALSSCEKDEDRIIIKEGEPGILSASQTNLVLTAEDKDKDAITFTWTKPDFGFNAAPNYALEFGTVGSEFADPVVVDVENALVRTFKVSELNNIADNLGLPGFEAGVMEVRIRASVSDFYEPVVSAPVEVNVTPYLAEPEWPVIYLVGAASENEWDATRAVPFFRDEEDPFVYTLTTHLRTGDFKLLANRGSWNTAWGMGTTNNDGSVNLAFRPNEDTPDVSNFTGLVPAEGYYTIRVSLRTNTITIEPYAQGATATTYPSIGIVGAFSDWGNNPDVVMTNSTFNPHIWYGTLTLANDSEVKFRANSQWTTNWGAGADVTKWYGKGSFGSANIKMTAGTYQVQFNDLTGNYVFVAQ